MPRYCRTNVSERLTSHQPAGRERVSALSQKTANRRHWVHSTSRKIARNLCIYDGQPGSSRDVASATAWVDRITEVSCWILLLSPEAKFE